jgi:hypothetical protein
MEIQGVHSGGSREELNTLRNPNVNAGAFCFFFFSLPDCQWLANVQQHLILLLNDIPLRRHCNCLG